MNSKMKKYVPSLLAGAAAVGLGVRSSSAALTVASYAGGMETLNGVSYTDVYFFLTGFTGTDTNTALGHAPSLISLDGEFQATGGASLFVPGNSTAGDKANWTNFITPSGEGIAYTSGADSSYVNFPAITTGFTRTGTGTGTAVTTKSGTTYSSLTGTSTGFGDTTGTGVANEWYDGGSSSGDILPGAANQSLATAFFAGTASAPNLIASILVSGSGGVSYSGTASTYDSNGESTTFSYGATTSSVTPTGSNKIVSLLTTGTAPTGTAPNGYGAAPLGTLTVTNAGGTGKYFPGYLNIPGGATSGYIAVKGFLPADAPEVYALQVAVGGVVLAPTDTRLATIIADIKANDDANSISTAGITTVVGSPYASIFGGYDILVPSSVAGGSSPYFAFDFSSSGSDTTDGDSALGPVTVTSIAAVPEPATAAGVILGAAGLLLGRRKNRVQAV
jgi:hypothetical protein